MDCYDQFLYIVICLQIDGGKATDEEKTAIFNVFPVTNINQNTFYTVKPLDLQLGGSYVVWVMGMQQILK